MYFGVDFVSFDETGGRTNRGCFVVLRRRYLVPRIFARLLWTTGRHEEMPLRERVMLCTGEG